jgi:hypothetical protein
MIDLPLDDSQRDLVRPSSRAVFSGAYALEALAVIAQESRFYQGQIARTTGCEPSYAGDLMKRLEAVGLIEPLDRDPGQVRKYYRRLPSPLWQFCVDLIAHLLAEPSSGITRLADRM